MHQENVHEITVVETEELYAIREIAASHGVDVQEIPSLELEPVTTVALLLIGSALAVGAVMRVIETRKGGQVIDLRPGSPKMLYRDKGVVYGLVIILARDGTIRVEVKEPKDMFGQVIEAVSRMVIEITKSPLDVIADAVATAAGDKATVTKDQSRPK